MLALPVLVLSWSGYAQQGLVGQWQGQVQGIGNARLVITAVRPNGQVEGRMEFDLNSFVSTFADKPSMSDKTSRGIASGSTLTIDAALGGTYRLTLSGDQLSGRYIRGTTFDGAATFKRI
jgi:hypothetical protein